MSKRLIRWAIAVAAAVGIFGLAAASTPAATCDSWVNAAGGAWETGANWSTGAPPTSSQRACIVQALTAPVVLNSSPTVAGLTLGGSSGTAELESNGNQTLTLGGNSTIADTGVLAVEFWGLVVHQTGTLTNHGVIIPAASGLQFVGNLVNAADGLILPSSGFYFDGPGTLTNIGALSLSGGAALVSPYNGGSDAKIINAGTIQNTSTSDSTIGAGATLEETSGTTTGIPLQIDGGTLDLAGPGASLYRMVGNSTLAGTVAKAQTVVLDGNITTAGSLANNGTLTGFEGPHLTVPSGDALTNNGLISLPGVNLTTAGNVRNAATGRITISGATLGVAKLTNDGTIVVGPNSTLTTTGTGGAIDNDGGTIRNGGMVTLSSSGGTFIEGAGTETGNMVAVNSPGALRLTGGGASGFALNGATFSGNIAAGQVVQYGVMHATGSFTNSGTMFPRGGETYLPSGDTLTNEGLIAGTGSLTLDGNLTNALGGRINLQQVIGLAGSHETITNDGTVYMPCCGGFHIDGSNTTNNTFVNHGTYYMGLAPSDASLSWGSTDFVNISGVQAGSSGDDITLDGTIVPLPSGAELPPPPMSPQSTSFLISSVPGTNPPPDWTLACGFSVARSNWGGSCSNPDGARITAASNSTLDPTITTVAGSGTCNGNNTCSSTYGQPVTITAAVSSEYGPAPTGTVTLLADLVNQPFPDERVPYVLGTVPVSTAGGVTSGSLTRLLPPGDFHLSAIYNGDSHSLMSAAMFTTYQEQIVAQATTTTTLTASPASPVFGNAVTLKATITPSQAGGTPTGTVKFGVGSSQFTLGDVPVVTKNGVTTATLTTTALPEGANTVYAVYSGDYNYGSSNLASTTVTEGTPIAPTHVTVSGPSSVMHGTTYTATASTNGTGAKYWALAASPARPSGMTINSSTGAVTFAVPATGLAKFSYVVVATNAAGRKQSSVVTLTVT
jgi:hypothetical protein